jgi:hypothetical protein
MRLMNKTTLLSLTALILIASLAVAQGRGHGTKDGAGEGRGGRTHARMERRAHVRAFLRELGFTDTQKAQALQAARTVQPVAEAARAQARQIVQAARAANPTGSREAIRASVKDQLKAVRENAAAQILPSGRALLASLTPDQRARIQAALTKHGKTFDEERVARRLGFLLARPRAVQFLEGHVKH